MPLDLVDVVLPEMPLPDRVLPEVVEVGRGVARGGGGGEGDVGGGNTSRPGPSPVGAPPAA